MNHFPLKWPKNGPSKTWCVRGGAVLLAACLCGGAVLAAGGQNDPLVTLSYLTQTATPDILEQVEKKADQRQTELLEKFNAAIDDYRRTPAQSDSSASYTVLTLSSGQHLSLAAGGEVLLRQGAVTLSGGLLTDMTAGTSLSSGALSANHLYLAADAACSITASGAVTLLVRGECAVS